MKFALLVLALFAVLAAALAYRPAPPPKEPIIESVDFLTRYLDSIVAIFDEDEAQGGCSGAVSHAMAQVGKKYQMGANGPNAWDCSSLVGMAVRNGCGVNLPRTSGEICTRGSSVPVSSIQAGDIICYPGHVAIATSSTHLVHAANSNRGVVTDPIYSKNTITSVRRL